MLCPAGKAFPDEITDAPLTTEIGTFTYGRTNIVPVQAEVPMKIRLLGVLSIACAVASFTPVWAGPVGMQRNVSPDERPLVLSQLQAKQLEVGRQLPEPPKGPAMAQYWDKRLQLQDLIDRIQSGQPVSPDEINEALQPTYRVKSAACS